MDRQARCRERLALQRQGMRGFALRTAEGHWDGHLHQVLARAQTQADKHGATVYLVRNDGKLYHQRDGRALGPVIDPTDPSHVLGLDLRFRVRRAGMRNFEAALRKRNVKSSEARLL